jgi:hypothetical protein
MKILAARAGQEANAAGKKKNRSARGNRVRRSIKDFTILK